MKKRCVERPVDGGGKHLVGRVRVLCKWVDLYLPRWPVLLRARTGNVVSFRGRTGVCGLITCPQRRPFDALLVFPFPPYLVVQLPNMNYGKKDEDADTGLVRVDRTQVFQEGQAARFCPLPNSTLKMLTCEIQRACSTPRPYKLASAESS